MCDYFQKAGRFFRPRASCTAWLAMWIPRAELCELSTVVTALQRMLATERAKVPDFAAVTVGPVGEVFEALLGGKPEAFTQFLRHLAFRTSAPFKLCEPSTSVLV
jgi:hypothetical protein